MKMKTILPLAILILCSLLSVGKLLSSLLRFPTFSPVDFTESTEELGNPYVGWYQMYGYMLSDETSPDLSLISNQGHGPGLVLLQFNLSNYAATPVSSAGLQQLDQILAAWQASGKQLILRFLYDWDGNAYGTEPEDISLIMEHMSQVCGTVNRYAGSVYILQGIFIGAWGEMHGSNHLDAGNMALLTRHLAQATDPGIFLAVRTPEQWRTITGCSQPPGADNIAAGSPADGSDNPGSLTGGQDPAGSPAGRQGTPGSSNIEHTLAARLGLFNDGMMGSPTDLGTYASDEETPATPYAKRSLQEELLFQDALCAFVPNGGEAAGGPTPYNDLPAAIAYLSAIHASYLNSGYDETVLSKWKASVYSGKDAFGGMNGYDYISRHLGYRYVLRSAEFSYASPADAEGTFSISIENTGFSNAYRSFDVSLTLKHQLSGRKHVFPVETDTRLWGSGTETSLEIPVPVRSLSPGTYDAVLAVRDPVSGMEIRLANENARVGEGYLAGTLAVRLLPQ